jgi:hypothetical protein
MTRFGYT